MTEKQGGGLDSEKKGVPYQWRSPKWERLKHPKGSSLP